jgi:hypothetical protein
MLQQLCCPAFSSSSVRRFMLTVFGLPHCFACLPRPVCTADLLYEELWRILGACFFTGAIICYSLKVGC